MTTSEKDLARLAEAVGLTPVEWDFLKGQVGRLPSETEIQMIGVMWSEHCSYKSSKKFLKKLKTKAPAVLQGPGENAGLVAFDDRRALAFKVESHNHPSFVEPFQGAATGVGGILRDIFTMGARPIANGNYLRFGKLDLTKQRFLLDGVVSGIAHYGNCVGIPTVAGEVRTDSAYNGNILVNVFSLGVVDRKKVFKAGTATPGSSVMIWGAKTGRDGIHGASLLASADFSEENAGDGQKVRVQVGDPFKEKCLMEATLEAMTNLASDLIAIQDMGAAGLTCSTMEISYKSNVGMTIALEKVPAREPGMKPFELLLSESQERMLAVVKAGSEDKFKALLEKWGCEGETIGHTTAGDQLLMTFNGETVVNLPVQKVQDPPPFETPEPEAPSADEGRDLRPWTAPNEWDVLKAMLGVPSVATKRDIYQRYDSTVGGGTLLGPGHEAAVIWTGETPDEFCGVAFKGICNEQWSKIDPRGAMRANMLTSLRGLACAGARPLGYTDGVNLGNPKEPQTLWALDESIAGMNEVAEAYEIACVSGNVSLYNQTVVNDQKQNIPPTIFAVVVGKVDDVRKVRPSVFQKAGSEVWLLEALSAGNDDYPQGSLYERMIRGGLSGLPPFDIAAEKLVQDACLRGLEQDLFLSTRNISEGGMAVSLAKACFGVDPDREPWGFEGDLLKYQTRRETLLFGEGGGRVIVEIDPAKRSELMKLGMEMRISVKRLGSVTDKGVFQLKPWMSGSVTELFKEWSSVFK